MNRLPHPSHSATRRCRLAAKDRRIAALEAVEQATRSHEAGQSRSVATSTEESMQHMAKLQSDLAQRAAELHQLEAQHEEELRGWRLRVADATLAEDAAQAGREAAEGAAAELRVAVRGAEQRAQTAVAALRAVRSAVHALQSQYKALRSATVDSVGSLSSELQASVECVMEAVAGGMAAESDRNAEVDEMHERTSKLEVEHRQAQVIELGQAKRFLPCLLTMPGLLLPTAAH